MERRLPPCLASSADGGGGGLLSGLRPEPAPSHRACAMLGLRLSGRGLIAPTGSKPWRVIGHFVASGFRQFSPEPRSDWQPPVGRSSRNARRGGCAYRGARRHAACPDAAAPIHGGGMGINPAVSVLLRFPGAA